MLTRTEIAAFERDGWLMLPGFVSPADCDRLKARAEAIVGAFDPDSTRTVFSTTDQLRTSDDYFLTSGDTVRCFFEEEARDAGGALVQAKARSINKIGHAMHDLDAVFDGFSRTAALRQVCEDLGVARPLLLQSMIIFKNPRIGGLVDCHQDSTYLYTEPESCLGLWFALEDSDRDNACLWALPGAHRGALKRRFHRDGKGGVAVDVRDASPWPLESGVALEARKGTLIALHGRLPHWSAANRSARSRVAYTLHVVDAGARYAPDNWLQRGADMPLRGFA